MGSRMATRLLAAHHDVVVYNRTPERTRPLEQGGAKVAVTAKQLAAGVDIVFSSVTNDAALEQVMFGPDGALIVPSVVTTTPSFQCTPVDGRRGRAWTATSAAPAVATASASCSESIARVVRSSVTGSAFREFNCFSNHARVRHGAPSAVWPG